ncbi:MAG TPA: hypothetical protein VM925_34710 [Labilithrix sp.]|nr:hypothetical protein [Labilithrix sp.]
MRQKATSIVVAIVVVIAAIAACDGGTESACKVDTDCPQGTICRAERCGPVGGEAGAPAPIEAGAATCSSDGLLCSSADECCSRACTDGRCGVAPPGSNTPSCRGVYELCQNDCCSGLTCIAGACR